jgi:hypothetical protein
MNHMDLLDALGYAQRYIDTDVASTKNIEKEINKMDERRLMNGMKKGMTVVVIEHPNKRGWRGTIEAFDYNHLRVGVRFSAREELTWFAPSCLRIAYQHVSFTQSTDGINWTLGTSYKPKKVIYDEAAGVTVVLWTDGTKTIVRAAEGEEHDAYLGYCIALAKKMHGTNSALKRELEKVLVVKKELKLDISVSPLPSMKELANKVTEVMQKFHDETTKGE